MKKWILVFVACIVGILSGCQSEKAISIPDGFTYLEGDIESGYVIQDGNGNEFVWIPVTKLSRYDFEQNVFVDGDEAIGRFYYGEGNERSIENPKIDAFKRSVQKYNGFYVSRYEIGDASSDSYRTKNQKGIVVSKKNQIPYNYVSRDEAFLLCQGYSTNEKVVSALMNSYAYDAMMQYIGEEYWEKEKNTHQSLGKTGVECVKNIYDLSGNVAEWTTEYSSNAFYEHYEDCVIRGGSFADFESSPVSRMSMDNIESEYIGFRMILYLE